MHALLSFHVILRRVTVLACAVPLLIGGCGTGKLEDALATNSLGAPAAAGATRPVAGQPSAADPGSPTPATLAPQQSGGVASALTPPGSIVGFRRSTVVLYDSEASNSGQRVPISSLDVPVKLDTASAAGPRLPIPTAYGLRWLDRSDVITN